MTYDEAVTKLGRKILEEKGISAWRVIDVSFDFQQGGGCPTCSYTDYDVDVYYHAVEGGQRLIATKTYPSMGDIIKELIEA